MDSWVQPFLRLPGPPTLLVTTAPSWRVSHLPERGDLIFSKPPKSQRKSLSFLPKTPSDVQTQGQGGAASMMSPQRTGWVCGVEKGNSSVSEMLFFTLVFPCGLLLSLPFLTSEQWFPHCIQPDPHLDPKAGRHQRAPSSVSKDQPRPSSSFSPKEGPPFPLAGF